MVTDNQVRRLFRLLNTETTLSVAASKAGMDVKTARCYKQKRKLPTELAQQVIEGARDVCALHCASPR